MKFGIVASFVALACLAVTPSPSVAQDKAQVFTPAGQWSVDYGDDYCRLARNFSDGSNTAAIAFERIQPGPFTRMIVVSDAVRPFRSADTIGWHFTPSDPERKTPYTKSQTPDGHAYYNLGMMTLAPSTGPNPSPFIIRKDFVSDTPTPPGIKNAPPNSGPPPPPAYDRAKEQADAKAITGLAIDGGLDTPVQVETGDLSAPIAALQACADDLAKSWGLDPAKLQTQQAAAIPDHGGVGWLPQGTIGFADLPKLSGGSNQVRIMVDAAGKPTSCVIHWATLDQTTNDKICKTLMANASFTPAKDAGGQAMPGYWVASPTFLGPPFPGGRKR